jgi:hypothetical protein
MLKAAVDDRLLLVNPAAHRGRQLRFVVSKAVRQEEIKAMTAEQRERFLEAARARVEPRYYALFATPAETLRLGAY